MQEVFKKQFRSTINVSEVGEFLLKRQVGSPVPLETIVVENDEQNGTWLEIRNSFYNYDDITGRYVCQTSYGPSYTDTKMRCNPDVFDQYKDALEKTVKAYLEIYKPNNDQDIIFEQEDFLFDGMEASLRLDEEPIYEFRGQPFYKYLVSVYLRSSAAEVCTMTDLMLWEELNQLG